MPGEFEAVHESGSVESSHALRDGNRTKLSGCDGPVRAEEEPPVAIPQFGEAGDARPARERGEPGRAEGLVEAPVRRGGLVGREPVDGEDAPGLQVRAEPLEPFACEQAAVRQAAGTGQVREDRVERAGLLECLPDVVDLYDDPVI